MKCLLPKPRRPHTLRGTGLLITTHHAMGREGLEWEVEPVEGQRLGANAGVRIGPTQNEPAKSHHTHESTSPWITMPSLFQN